MNSLYEFPRRQLRDRSCASSTYSRAYSHEGRRSHTEADSVRFSRTGARHPTGANRSSCAVYFSFPLHETGRIVYHMGESAAKSMDEAAKASKITDRQTESTLKRLWLTYYNDTLYEKGLITESERNRMRVLIKSRTFSAER